MSALSTVRSTRSTCRRSAAALLTNPAVLAGLLVSFIAPSVTAERLPIRSYTTEHGLAHERVRRIVRDPRGFLWFCTVDGLSRFDGVEFVSYRTGDGLPDPWVTDFLTSRDGAYWVATNGGVARFDPLAQRVAPDGQRLTDARPRLPFTRVAFTGPPTQRQVRVLMEDRAGRVWAGGRGGLSVLDIRGSTLTFRPVVPSPAAMVTSLVEGADGGLWIGTLDGLLHRRTSGDVLAEPTAAHAGVRRVRALVLDATGRLWIGHDEGLLVLGPGARVPQVTSSRSHRPRNCGAGPSRHRRLRLPTKVDDACTMSVADGLIDRRVRALAVGLDRHVRIGTAAGLSDVDGAHITSVSPAHGFIEDAINAVTEDRDGNLWIGTDSLGAVRIAAFGLVSYFHADGLRNDYVPSLMEGDGGRVIAVSGAHFTINEFDGRRFVAARFKVPPGVPDDRYFCVLRDHLGAWWLGTPMGLYRFPAVRKTTDIARAAPDAHYAGLPRLPSDDVFPLFEDRRGDIWLISQLPDHVKLLRWRRATNDFQTYGASEGLPDLTSRPAISRPAITEGPAGHLFFGFREAGLFAYRAGRFEAILDRGKLFGVVSLHVDRLGRLWIVGVDGSVSRFDNLSTRHLTRDARVTRSLKSANVKCMVDDANGHFYFGTTSGVIEIDPETGDTWRYTTAEGLARNEVWSALASRGEIWFGTIAGVSRLDTTRLRASPRAPRALIRTVHVNADARIVSELGEHAVSGLTLAPGERRVAIDFFALSFASGERLMYQYRLEGAEEDWSTPTAVRSVDYAHLSPGPYRFLVHAVTLSGATSAIPASVSFRILPPIWRRWWFAALASVFVVGLVAVLYRYRVAQIVAIERVRTRIATDLHDDIGASLSQIAILSELARGEADTRPATANTLDRIATTSRELVESMGDIVWAINPKRDRVGDLLQRMRHFASDTFTARSIDFTFRAPDAGRDVALPADVRREVLLIFKEAVNNIARHARCHHADIDVRIERDGLVLQVADDGQGLSASTGRDGGHGLQSMQERATRLSGCLEVHTGRYRGTTLVLRVPWRRPRGAT